MVFIASIICVASTLYLCRPEIVIKLILAGISLDGNESHVLLGGGGLVIMV